MSFFKICSATKKRQKEAENGSKNSDLAIVVGGKNSSNTNKLVEICGRNCRTFFVETEKDLEQVNFNFVGKKVFLTAGASTPDFLIHRVFDKLSDIVK